MAKIHFRLLGMNAHPTMGCGLSGLGWDSTRSAGIVTCQNCKRSIPFQTAAKRETGRGSVSRS